MAISKQSKPGRELPLSGVASQGTMISSILESDHCLREYNGGLTKFRSGGQCNDHYRIRKCDSRRTARLAHLRLTTTINRVVPGHKWHWLVFGKAGEPACWS